MTEPKVIHAAKLPNDWLSKEDLAALTPKILADHVKALVPLIAANAHEAERQRKPIDEVWFALRKTGMFYHFVPHSYGGLEFSAEDLIDIILPIAEACPSTAWAASFVSIHNRIFALFPKKARDEVFTKYPYISAPSVNTSPVTLVPTEGGCRVTGRMKWAAGVTHSDWLICIGVIKGSNPPKTCYCTMPIDQGMILDTWFMDGAAGTGSHDIVINDVFVPEHMILDTAVMPHNSFYAAPTLLTLTAAMSPVGAAKGAVKLFREYMQKRGEFGSKTKTSERASQQMRLAQADIQVRTAEALLRDIAHWIEKHRKEPTPIPISERISHRAQIVQAVSEARKATVSVCEAAGAGMHNLDNPLQRFLRDVNTMSTHITFDHDMAIEQHGRAMIGLPPRSPLLWDQRGACSSYSATTMVPE